MRPKTLCIAAPPRRYLLRRGAAAEACRGRGAHILCLDGFSFGKLGHFDDGCGSLFQWIAFLAEPLVYDEERRSSAQCVYTESQAFMTNIPMVYHEAPTTKLR